MKITRKDTLWAVSLALEGKKWHRMKVEGDPTPHELKVHRYAAIDADIARLREMKDELKARLK